MAPLFSLIAVVFSSLFLCITSSKETVVVFGGNGFVGREICKEALSRGYRVISITRSGAPALYASDEWAQQVEWFKADALQPVSYEPFLRKQDPVAIFTMMGTAAPYKQLTRSYEDIFKYAGTTNINVCEIAARLESVRKFVYIGADAENLGVSAERKNDSYALWTRLWYGQVMAKMAVEECVEGKFGKNGISFRPGVMAGNERVEAFGNVVEFNRLPFWGKETMQKMYKMVIPNVFAASELAQDSLDFIEDKDSDTFHCANHSKKKDGDLSKTMQMVLEYMDFIILAVITFLSIFVVFQAMRCCVKGN